MGTNRAWLLLTLSLAWHSVDCFTHSPNKHTHTHTYTHTISAARLSVMRNRLLKFKVAASQFPPFRSCCFTSVFHVVRVGCECRSRQGLHGHASSGSAPGSKRKSATTAVTSFLSLCSRRGKAYDVHQRSSNDSLNSQPNRPPIRLSAKGGEDTAHDSPLLLGGIPSYKTMLLFISTTTLIWLSEPLLSLVDTTVVGQYSHVLQLAALGPATMLMDSAIYLTYFLAIATTNTVANGLAKQDYRELQTATSQVMGLATVLGAMLTATIFFAGRPLLHWAAGGSSSPALIQLALQYCRIRSLVAPLSILGMVAQSVCLACLDTTTPAMAVAVASLVNVLGDVALVPHFGMVGAAAATAAASSSAALLLLRQTRRTMKSWREEERRGSGRVADVVMDEVMTLGQGNHTQAAPSSPRPVPLWSLPDPVAFISLLWKTGPIFFTIVGKIICYSALSLRATDFGVTAVAAHNVMLRVFFLHATFGDSLSQASQTFMPRVMTGPNRRSSLTKLLRRLAVVAAGIGVATNLAGELVLTKFGSSFTKDEAVLSLLMHKHTAQWAGWTLLLHPFAMMLEGCILANQDLVFLLGSYVVTMALHFASLRLSATSFSGVWRALFFFQTFRLTQFCLRTWNQMFRKTEVASTVTVIGGGVAASSVPTINYYET